MKRTYLMVALAFAAATTWAQTMANATLHFAETNTTTKVATSKAYTMAQDVAKAASLPDVSQIISEQPAGALYADMYRSCKGYNDGYERTFDAYAADIVVSNDGKKLYMKDFCAVFPTGWLVGDIKDGGVVEFNFPQVVYHQTQDASGQSYEVTGYAWKVIADNVNYKINIDQNQTVKFSWDGKTLKQENPDDIIAMCNASGQFLGYGTYNNTLSVMDEKPVTLPSDVSSETYIMTYTDYLTQTPTDANVSVAISGSDIYLGGFYNNCWVKGTWDGSKATFPTKQYLGTETITNKIHEYFLGFDISDDRQDATLADNIVFNYDAATETFSTTTAIGVNQGYETRALVAVLENVSMKNAHYVVDAPAAPEIYAVMPYGNADDPTIGAIAYINSDKTASGATLNSNNIVYNIYLDGKLFTFTPSVYQFLSQNLVDVPYAYFDYNYTQSNGMKGYDFGVYMDRQYIYFYKDFKTIGVKAIYVDGSKRYESPLVTMDVASGNITTGINTVENDVAGKASAYYTLDGSRVSAPTNGIFIQKMTTTDGQTKTVKVAR